MSGALPQPPPEQRTLFTAGDAAAACQQQSDSALGTRWRDRRKRRGFPRGRARLIEIRDHRGAGTKTDPINLQILHDPLDVVSRLGKWNAFHPIDRIYLGIAWIAVLFHPLLDAAAAGVVAGE